MDIFLQKKYSFEFEVSREPCNSSIYQGGTGRGGKTANHTPAAASALKHTVGATFYANYIFQSNSRNSTTRKGERESTNEFIKSAQLLPLVGR